MAVSGFIAFSSVGSANVGTGLSYNDFFDGSNNPIDEAFDGTAVSGFTPDVAFNTVESWNNYTVLPVTANFGASTLQGEGAVAVTGTSITSGDSSGHWQIVGGLLSPSATGEGAIAGSYSLALDDGQLIDITVEATTKHVRTTTELINAVNTWKSARVDGFNIAMRPGDYEMHDGSNPYGVFRSINNSGSTDWLIVRSDDPTNHARFYNTHNHTNNGANGVINAYLRFSHVDFYMTQAWATANPRFFFEYTSSSNIQYLEFLGCNFSGEAYTQAEYDDPDLFGPIYNDGDQALPICILANRAGSWKVEDCTFSHTHTPIMGLQLTGPCSFQRNEIDTFYFDAVRFTAPGDSWTIAGTKIVKDNVIGGGFAVNNEMSASSPHNDSFQIFNDTGDTNNRVEDMILTNNICWGSDHARANAVQTMLFQSAFKDCVIAENVFMPKSVAWGFLIEGASAGDSIQFINNTGLFWGKASPSTAWRHDGPTNRGNATVYGMVTDGSEQHTTSTPWNLFRLNNSINMGNWDQFSGSGTVSGEASARDYATPNAGSTVATNNQGALTTAGEFRSLGYGPRDSMGAPTLLATGNAGELQITRSAAPTKTEGGAITGYYASYKKTSDAETEWAVADMGLTSPYTLTGLEGGVEYQVRLVPYIANGIPGVVGAVAAETPDGASVFTPNAISNEGTRYVQSASYTPGTMGKEGTLSIWLYDVRASGNPLQMRTSGGTEKVLLRTGATGNFLLDLDNAAGTRIGYFLTNADVLAENAWNHVLISWNLATSTMQVYVNDVQVTSFASGPTLSNDSVADCARIAVFADYGGTNIYQGDIAEPWMDTVYRDLSVEANRRYFITAEGAPADLIDFGTPHLYLHNPAANFGTNLGSGGNLGFGGTGSFTDVTPPQPSYTAYGVDSNSQTAYFLDYGSTVGNLSAFTISAWVKPNSRASDFNFVSAYISGTYLIRIGALADGRANVEVHTGSELVVLQRSNADLATVGTWKHWFVSVDLTGATAVCKLFIDQVEITDFNLNTLGTSGPYTTGDIQRFTTHARIANTFPMDGALADVYFDNVYRTTPADFHNSGSPKDLSAVGSPFYLLTGNAAAFGNNTNGSEDAMTVSGTPTDVTGPT
jgi:hypothetical protein